MAGPARPAPPSLQRAAPWLLMLLGFLHAALYAWLIPPWQGPDEPRHFEYIAQLAAGIRPTEPAADALQRAIIASMIETRFWDYGYSINPYDPANPPQTLDEIWPGFAHQTHQPPLYYRLTSLIVRAAGRLPLVVQLRWTRLFSALLCAGVIGLTWATARTLFPTRPGLAGLIAFFVLCLPMHSFAYAMVNNDNLVAFFVCAQVWLAARTVRAGLRPLEWLAQTALVALALLTKRTGFIAPALWALTLLFAGWEGFRRRRGALIALGALAALVLAGALLLITARPLLRQLWGGFFHLPKDVLELAFSGRYAEALVKTPYLYYSRMIFESFWARFGWLNVRLAEGWYFVVAGFCGLAGLGLLRLGAANQPRQMALQAYQWRTLLVFVSVSILAYALIMAKEVLYLSYAAGVVPQGRYLFPVVIPLATLFVVGMAQWPPAGRERLAGYVGAALLVAFDVLCIVGYILPFYRAWRPS